MRVVRNVRTTDIAFPHVVLTIGSFDGLHLGHRHVLREVLDDARRSGGTPAVLTMKPHPREFFSPEHAPNLLMTDEKKLTLLEQAGIEVVYVLEFNDETANLDRADFVNEILMARCHADELVVGHDFCFGKNALGDYNFLAQVAPEFGFHVRQVPPLLVDGERISSTLIRERILQGDLKKAERYLGRQYSVEGTVVPGRGIGAKLGFPTANVRPHHSAVPAQGVYVAEAQLGDRRIPAAVNIGIAPTIRQEDSTIEAHLLDFAQNILNEQIEIIFHQRLRPERKFPSHMELVTQITLDVEAVRGYFNMSLPD